MTVIIEQINDREFSVDGLQVNQDQNGNWVGNPEMTSQQVAAFQMHMRAVTQHNLKQTKATYRL